MQDPGKRKLAASGSDEGVLEMVPEEREEGEFDSFYVRITEPMDYVLTEELIQRFIDHGNFLIEDGQEESHGPLTIKSFQLHEPDVPEPPPDPWSDESRSQVEVPRPATLVELPERGDNLSSDPLATKAVSATTTALAAFAVSFLGVVALVNMRSACRPQRSSSISFRRADVLALAQDVQYSSVACELSPSSTIIAANA